MSLVLSTPKIQKSETNKSIFVFYFLNLQRNKRHHGELSFEGDECSTSKPIKPRTCVFH